MYKTAATGEVVRPSIPVTATIREEKIKNLNIVTEDPYTYTAKGKAKRVRKAVSSCRISDAYENSR